MGHYTKNNPVVLIYFLVLVVLQFQTHPAAVFAAATSVEKIESSSESSSSSPFWNEKNKESETSSFDFDEVQKQQHEQRIESSSSLIADLNFLFHEELKKLQVNKKKNSDYYYKTKRKDDSPFHDTSRLLTPYGPARRMLDKQAKKLHHLDPSSETTMRKTKKKMFADDHHQERNFRIDFWKEVVFPSSASSSSSRKDEYQLSQKERTKFSFDESLLDSIEETLVENTLPTRKQTATTGMRRLQTIGAPSTSPAGGGGGGGGGSFQPSPIGTDVLCPLDAAIPITYDDNGIIIAGSTIGEPANLITDAGCASSDGSPTAWYTFTTDQAATVVLTTYVCRNNNNVETILRDAVLETSPSLRTTDPPNRLFFAFLLFCYVS